MLFYSDSGGFALVNTKTASTILIHAPSGYATQADLGQTTADNLQNPSNFPAGVETIWLTLKTQLENLQTNTWGNIKAFNFNQLMLDLLRGYLDLERGIFFPMMKNFGDFFQLAGLGLVNGDFNSTIGAKDSTLDVEPNAIKSISVKIASGLLGDETEFRRAVLKILDYFFPRGFTEDNSAKLFELLYSLVVRYGDVLDGHVTTITFDATGNLTFS